MPDTREDPPGVPSPYADTPYDLLTADGLAPLSVNASRKDVDERYAAIAKRGTPTLHQREAWTTLRAPDRRLAVDIFQSVARQQLDALASLGATPPSVTPPDEPLVVGVPGPELAAWDTLPDEADPHRFPERALELGPLTGGGRTLRPPDVADLLGPALDS